MMISFLGIPTVYIWVTVIAVVAILLAIIIGIVPIGLWVRALVSNSYIPALSGILCASYVINDLVGDLHV